MYNFLWLQKSFYQKQEKEQLFLVLVFYRPALPTYALLIMRQQVFR